MYSLEHPSLKSYMNRFPARQYTVESDDTMYFLRFAACFGQFLMSHDVRSDVQPGAPQLEELHEPVPGQAVHGGERRHHVLPTVRGLLRPVPHEPRRHHQLQEPPHAYVQTTR